MLSLRINFHSLIVLCSPRNGAGVLRDQQFLHQHFSPVCVFGPALPSNCFFVFGGGRQLCGNPFRLMLDSFQPIAEVLHYTKWSASQSAPQNRKDKPPKRK